MGPTINVTLGVMFPKGVYQNSEGIKDLLVLFLSYFGGAFARTSSPNIG